MKEEAKNLYKRDFKLAKKAAKVLGEMKEEIKNLHKKDPALAKEVAKVLGYKIEVAKTIQANLEQEWVFDELNRLYKKYNKKWKTTYYKADRNSFNRILKQGIMGY